MFVACSTLCFSKEPLESALRTWPSWSSTRSTSALVESGGHLRPSEVAENLDASLAKLRHGPSLAPSAIGVDFGDLDPLGPVYRKRFEAVCRLAKATRRRRPDHPRRARWARRSTTR